jgi:perosamine synthetase
MVTTHSEDEWQSRYGELLSGLDGVEPPAADDADHRRSWFVYVVLLPRGVDREQVSSRLAEAGVEAGHYVPCVHLQPYMRERFGFAEGLCPVAEDASSRSLALPFFTAIAPEDQERVLEALEGALAR